MRKTLRELLRLDAVNASPILLNKGKQTWSAWKKLTTSHENAHETIFIAVVGKYTSHPDSYLSVIKSLEHAAMACSRKLKLIWVDAAHLEPGTEVASPETYHKAWHEICTAQGILVPGGFGTRGTEGMIAAVSLRVIVAEWMLNQGKGEIRSHDIEALSRSVYAGSPIISTF